MSKHSWLPAGFERLERVPGRGRVDSGSPVGVLLTWAATIRDIQTIPAILALHHRHMNLARAKRTIEALVEDGRAFALVPKVESVDALTQELAAAGVKITVIGRTTPDIAAIRDRLGLTQEEFAVRYGLELDAIRNWEHGRRMPDTAALSYLRAISADPNGVQDAVWAGA